MKQNKSVQIIFLSLILSCFFLSGEVFAYKESDLKKLKSTNSCPKCDLSMADLRNANLIRAKLSEADLSGAYLKGAKLREVTLRKADLRRADLSGTDLSGADLKGANLTKANLSNAKLIEANLREVTLRKADLRKADLSGADLSGAILSRAKLSNANLSNANLSKANLKRADLSGADLSGAYPDSYVKKSILQEKERKAKQVLALQKKKEKERKARQALALQKKKEKKRKAKQALALQKKKEKERKKRLDHPMKELGSFYQTYETLKECYEVRIGYVLVYVNFVEMGNFKSWAKPIENGIFKKFPEVKSMKEQIWAEFTKTIPFSYGYIGLVSTEQFVGGVPEMPSNYLEGMVVCENFITNYNKLIKTYGGGGGGSTREKDF